MPSDRWPREAVARTRGGTRLTPGDGVTLPFATARADLEVLTLNEMRRMEKVKDPVMLLTCGI